MELSGNDLQKAYAYYGVLSRNQSTPEFRTVQKKNWPLILRTTGQNLFKMQSCSKRIKTVYESAKKTHLEADQHRLLEWIHQDFQMNGAALDKKKRKHVMLKSIKPYQSYTPPFLTIYFTMRKTMLPI